MNPNSTPVTSTPSSSPSVPAVGRARRGRRARPAVFTGLNLTPDQVKTAVRAVLDGAEAAVKALQPQVPSAFLTGKVVVGLGSGTGTFTQAMADVQETYGTAIGHVPSDPKVMRSNAALFTAVQAAAAPVRGLLVLLENIGNYAGQQSYQDARRIYQHAVVSAGVNPALATAIAPFREARTRQGKKAASTRARNSQVRAGAPESAGADTLPSSSTTVTTTQR